MRVLLTTTHPWLCAGNNEEQEEMCVLDEELRGLVSELDSPGWAFVNEGTEEKKKQGWVETR